MVQLTSKFTLACTKQGVFFNFCWVTWLNSRVTRYVLYASQTSCVALELYFLCGTRPILCVLHSTKKHTSQTSCAACESAFLCAACKLTAILFQRRIREYNEMACKQNMIKCVDTQKIVFCQVFMYSYSNHSNPLWISL